jgi:hypothetical protein
LQSVNDDNLNVRILAVKDGKHHEPSTEFYDRHKDVGVYAATIQRNRAKLPAIVAKIEEMMDHVRVAFFGANTMMDLMVKYGGLDPGQVKCLVDGFLFDCIEEIHGIPVMHPQALRGYQPDVCVVLARFGENEVARQAREFNIRNIVKFSDLLRSV